MRNMNKFENILKGIYDIVKREFITISTSYAILLVLVGGIIGYGFLYNIMYAPNVVRNAPVVVVDNAKTELSRKFIYHLDATPEIKIVSTGADYIEAKDYMHNNEAVAIIVLPYDFDEKINTGRQAVMVTYQSTKVFLYSLYVEKGITFSLLDLNDRIRPDQVVFLPPEDVSAMTSSSSPIQAVTIPLYNYTEGYGTYLIPGVLMVILFQTLMMVIAMISGGEVEKRTINLYQPYSKTWGSLTLLIISKSLVYVMLYLIFSVLYVELLPILFELPDIGNRMTIYTMMIPYLFATSFFGLAMSIFFTDSDSPIPAIAFFSVGLIFLSGISYPLELMPWYWKMCHFIFPAAPGTLSFVKINSMGATLQDIRIEYITLCVQCLIYYVLAVLSYRYKLIKYKEPILQNAK